MANWKKYSKQAQAESNDNDNWEKEAKVSGSYKTATWILGSLLVLAVVCSILFLSKNNTLMDKTAKLEQTNMDLDEMKLGLEEQLTSLEGEYDTAIGKNGELQAEIETKVNEIEVLQTKIRQVRNQLNSSEKKSTKMQERLAQLETLKDSLQTDVASLKGENQDLIAARDELTRTLEENDQQIASLNDQIVELTTTNEAMEERLFRTAPAGFKAGNFSVDVEQRNDKVTTKARKAKEIKVNFDLPYVPASKQGETELYLVVTDINGQPVNEIASSPVSVPTPEANLQVAAVDINTVDLKESQSVAMSFEPTERLKAGEYSLMIYSDEGYLGSTGFRLR
ncbi:MAG: hypothetical protein AAGI49_05165 [Bacteroidota bacterium]